MNTSEFAELLAAASAAASARVNDEIAHRVRWVLADTVGVALAAGRRPAALALVADDTLTGRWRHPEPSLDYPALLLTAEGGWASTDRAAYVNGSIIGDLELDEGVRPTGHPAAHVIPAVLAAGQALGCTLGQCLDALVVGYEVAAALFESFTLTPGIHPHGHLGSIAAATAVSHLQDLDPLPAAMVAATTPLLTTWGPCRDGATVRNTWMGYSAATGVLAHRLVAAGWTGSIQTLNTAFDGIVAARHVTTNAPSVPRIASGYFKLHSACALTHTSIEAAAVLGPVDPEIVARVQVRTTANNMKVSDQPTQAALSRRFSIPFTVATALVHGVVDVEHADHPSPEVLDLMRRVDVEEDRAFTDRWPAAAPANVTVNFYDGRTVTSQCDNALGTPSRPVDEARLRAKSAQLLNDDGRTWNYLMTVPESHPITEALTALPALAIATA